MLNNPFSTDCSQFATMENVVGSLADNFPVIAKHKLKFTFLTAATFYVCALPCTTNAGQYFIEIYDKHGSSTPMLFTGIIECIVISWIYGVDNFLDDIKFMLKIELGYYWRITWKYTSPVILLLLNIHSMTTNKPMSLYDHQFPAWAEIFGWTLTVFVLIQIPLFGLYVIFKQKNADNFFQVSFYK